MMGLFLRGVVVKVCGAGTPFYVYGGESRERGAKKTRPKPGFLFASNEGA
jgi:hypothetical protein